jgi:hypothetical protein
VSQLFPTFRTALGNTTRPNEPLPTASTKVTSNQKQQQHPNNSNEDVSMENVEAGASNTTNSKKRVVTLEPSAHTFAGASANRRDRSDPVMITDAISDVRVK